MIIALSRALMTRRVLCVSAVFSGVAVEPRACQTHWTTRSVKRRVGLPVARGVAPQRSRRV